MIEENWLVKANIDTTPFEDALAKCKHIKDVSGTTSAIGPNTKQLEIFDGFEYINLMTDELKTIFTVDIINDKIDLSKPHKLSLWSVEGGEHSYHRLHRHSMAGDEHLRINNCLSTVFYLNVPDEKNNPQFYFILEKNKGTEYHTITPKKGDLFIFPWSVYHGVYPQGPGLRKTVNLDFEFI